MYINSSIMRSGLIVRDFELLLEASSLDKVVDDGFATEQDYQDGVFDQKKLQLATRFQDFKDCMDFFDQKGLEFRKSINKRWGTSERLLKIIEQHVGRHLSHGALLLALDLRGTKLFPIDDRKDAFLNISNQSEF